MTRGRGQRLRPAELHRLELRVHRAGHRGEGARRHRARRWAASSPPVRCCSSSASSSTGSAPAGSTSSMPPVVTGAIVALIGLNLAPVAWASFQAQPLTAFITLTAILLFTVLLRGFLGRISILLGVIVGYLVAWPQHQLPTWPTNLERREVVRPPGLPDPELQLERDRSHRSGRRRPDRREHRSHQGGRLDDRPQPRPVAGTRLHG